CCGEFNGAAQNLVVAACDLLKRMQRIPMTRESTDSHPMILKLRQILSPSTCIFAQRNDWEVRGPGPAACADLQQLNLRISLELGKHPIEIKRVEYRRK